MAGQQVDVGFWLCCFMSYGGKKLCGASVAALKVEACEASW